MKLLILESPNKAETIQAYLNNMESGWKVIATNGHFKNLLEKTIAVKKVDSHYIGDFAIDNKKIYDLLKSNIQKASSIYIATDDDREGEAIASDIIDEFRLSADQYKRVLFSEISKKKIREILIDKTEGDIDLNKELVNARYSRRLIDRLVGYRLTPLLKYVLRDNKSVIIEGIGRVSFASLAILVEREKEINNFDAYYYKKISATYRVEDKEVFCIGEKKYIEGMDDELFYADVAKLKNDPHIVTLHDVEYEDIQPPKPILFSSLMSNVFYLYKYPTKQIATIAQKLFEGIKIGDEKIGLITYIRTDSYRMSTEIAREAFDIIPYMVIKKEDGPLGYDYVVSEQREYKNKKNAQDAHEAIRPVYLTPEYSPQNIRKYLSEEEYRVYDYIYKISLTTFMTNSSHISTKTEITCGDIKLKSETKEEVFDGWEIVGRYYVPFFKRFDKFENNPPTLYINSVLEPKEIDNWSRKAKSPERYGEGRFIETMTNKGIGRPSTLPNIIPELIKKGYVQSVKGMLKPTLTAEALVNWANENADWLTDINHARTFEEELSKIENGEADKDQLIQEYDTLIEELYKKYDFKDMETYKKEKPSAEQTKTLEMIQSKGVEVKENAFNSKLEATKVIKKYYESLKVCKCKECDTGHIIAYEKNYSCNNKDCKFVLWKNKVSGFIDNFKLDIDEVEFSESLLKKKNVFTENLHGKSAIFDADVFIENDERYGYGLKFKVKKGKK